MTTHRQSPRRTLTGGIVFAALAALSYLAAVLALGPVWSYQTVVMLHLGVTAVGYLAWLAPTRGHALGGALVAALAIPLLSWLGRSGAPVGLAWHALVCATVVALVRGLVFFRARPLRTLAVEVVLGVLGMALAVLLGGPTLVAQASAIWGYLLVQSLYPLVPGLAIRGGGRPDADPFDRATARLRGLLGEA